MAIGLAGIPPPDRPKMSAARAPWSAERALRWFLTAILIACLAVFAITTIHWPLVGDASLIHYIALLINHGMAPYRDISDMNMPGSYLVDDAVMHSLGGGALAWRSFDLLLIGTAMLASLLITLPYDWFAGVFAGVLLGLIHGRDGIFDMGQRDFVIAVLLLTGYAALFHAIRKEVPGWMLLFGLCSGYAAAIKPTFLPLAPVLLLTLAGFRMRDGRPVRAFLLCGIAGMLISLLGIWLWLWRWHAMGAFIHIVQGIMVYHATLARRPLGFLLLHSVSPLLPLVLVWILTKVLAPEFPPNRERILLWVGAGFGLISWIAQGKGYPYQRYPFIAFLLLLIGLDLVRAMRRTGAARIAACIGLACGVLHLAPRSTWAASRYDWRNTEFVTLLDSDLQALGGRHLSGLVQCVDTTGGCYNALYRLDIVQRSGFLYDEFLFGQDRGGIVATSRREFWRSIHSNPPRFIVVVDGLFPSGPPGFEKLDRWPQFKSWLQQCYSLHTQVTPPHSVYWWARRDLPRTYRIYSLRSALRDGCTK